MANGYVKIPIPFSSWDYNTGFDPPQRINPPSRESVLSPDALDIIGLQHLSVAKNNGKPSSPPRKERKHVCACVNKMMWVEFSWIETSRIYIYIYTVYIQYIVKSYKQRYNRICDFYTKIQS